MFRGATNVFEIGQFAAIYLEIRHFQKKLFRLGFCIQKVFFFYTSGSNANLTGKCQELDVK